MLDAEQKVSASDLSNSTGRTAAPTSVRAGDGTDVYAIDGADPEVLAYAMAKYSRSALTMRESLKEINSQRAEHFLNTFYFQYGHRSIADLAHIPFAIERLSLLAAIDLVDEQRWDGQERSTRYQNFRQSGWFTPNFGSETGTFTSAVQTLFAAYEHTGSKMYEALRASLARPDAMKPEAYERTLKARAFDVARYLLPLATNTSLGQIVNARTLETQVSRLLSSPFGEIRTLGEKLRSAAAEPAWNVGHQFVEEITERLDNLDPELSRHVRALLRREVRPAPTLVKYAAQSSYLIESRIVLSQAAADLMADQPLDPAPVVDLLDDDEPLEVELAASLLYPHCHYSYRQLRSNIAALPAARREELIGLGARDRGRHDELLRGFSAGVGFRFDILMDIGGFRDMHRHRRCVQLLQGYTDLHGYDDPVCPGQPTLAQAGIEQSFRSVMASTFEMFRALQRLEQPEASLSAQYLLPLATRRRALFKMDFAEALYIAELRSGVAGHFSYRRVAWEMYQAVAERHPALAKLFRIEDVNQPVDLLRR